MKKELPKVFHNQINKNIHNNASVFYGKGENRSEEVTVDEIFKLNQVYRTNTKITLKDKVIEKMIIGRTQNNLITFDNEIIPIMDILKIEVL